MTSSHEKPFSLYIHIPFCSRLCHYCDFAKTARFDEALVRDYLRRLGEDLGLWLSSPYFRGRRIHSIFLGGGTPGLFSQEYDKLFSILADKLSDDGEVSIEANPNDITLEKLSLWRDLGFNRLSIGVQTFSTLGLKALTRDHSSQGALSAIHLARNYFDNLNIDLIYGWPGQTETDLQNDLELACSLDLGHLSLYNLTLEPSTPLGKSYLRRNKDIHSDDRLADFYKLIRETLKQNNFLHDEVSNWSKPGYSCLHNWNYWQGKDYLGLGVGAHGFLSDERKGGTRYFT